VGYAPDIDAYAQTRCHRSFDLPAEPRRLWAFLEDLPERRVLDVAALTTYSACPSSCRRAENSS
jgi:hypothetical protein